MTISSPAQDYRAHIGRTAVAEQVITAAPVNALSATLERGVPPLGDGDPIPPGWHILFFQNVVPLPATGVDGHPERGGFMPPVALQRMMWAANATTFLRPLRVGERARRVSRIVDVVQSETEAGPVVRVDMHNEIIGESGPATIEERSSVFRDRPPPAFRPAGVDAMTPTPSWRRSIQPTTVLLHRFSALTLNSHRIHYDRDYATEVEGYPGLVFHGSLTVLLLIDLFGRGMPDTTLKTFHAEAIPPLYEPLYDVSEVVLLGEPDAARRSARLWACNGEGAITMRVEATY